MHKTFNFQNFQKRLKPVRRLATSTRKINAAFAQFSAASATHPPAIPSPPSQLPVEIICANGGKIIIKWADDHTSIFHARWLKANCGSSFHYPSGQRVRFPGDIDPSLAVSSADFCDETKSVHVKWCNGDSSSTFEAHWLRSNCYTRPKLPLAEEPIQAPPITSEFQVPEVEFREIMHSDAGLFKWLSAVNEHGLCLLKHVPCQHGMVREVSERVARVSHGFLYGDLFDVVSQDTPVNIAYTSLGLGLHMDLSYYESPPGLQMLHCMQFDECVQGGASFFFDAHYAAELLKQRNPAAFDALCRIPCTFQKDHMERTNPAYMRYQRPHIHVNHLGQVIAVFWSPQFEGPLAVPPEDVELYYDAYAAFQAIFEDAEVKKKSMLQMKLQEGDLISFNQRRMLHGRGEFRSNGGVRHLQGAYLNIDEYLCRFRVLRRKYDSQFPEMGPPGNASFSTCN